MAKAEIYSLNFRVSLETERGPNLFDPDENLVVQYVTSRLYPIEIFEHLQVTSDVEKSLPSIGNGPEAVVFSSDVFGGSLGAYLKVYDLGEPEAIDVVADVLGGGLGSSLQSYELEADELEFVADVVDGTIETKLISYMHAKPEGINFTSDIIGGTLEEA